jgi:hypothetical protein
LTAVTDRNLPASLLSSILGLLVAGGTDAETAPPITSYALSQPRLGMVLEFGYQRRKLVCQTRLDLDRSI